MIDSMSLSLLLGNASIPDSRTQSGTVALMDEHEFRAFYERTARPLWAYLSRIAGERQNVEDLLQEAYYRFYRLGARHESESHRRNSLFQIATNLVRDAARRARHHHDVALDEESTSSPLPPSPEPAPDRRVAARLDLQRALRSLDPVQREMLWLAYAQGASHDEIAAILGLRSVSIRTLLLRARRKLAGLLTAQSPAESGS